MEKSKSISSIAKQLHTNKQQLNDILVDNEYLIHRETNTTFRYFIDESLCKV